MGLSHFLFWSFLIIRIYICVRTTIHQFSWNSHGRSGAPMSEQYCFWQQSVQQNHWYEGKCALKLVFWLSFSQYGLFWGKNFKTIFGTPFPIERVIFIFVWRPIPSKMVMHPKNYFSHLFWKILFLGLESQHVQNNQFYWEILHALSCILISFFLCLPFLFLLHHVLLVLPCILLLPHGTFCVGLLCLFTLSL